MLQIKFSEAAKLRRRVIGSEGWCACAVGSANVGTINNSIICIPNAPLPAGPAPAPAYGAAGEATLWADSLVHGVSEYFGDKMVSLLLQANS